MNTLSPWFALAIPHDDISQPYLDESLFAANLQQVAMGTAPETYLDKETFFQKTHFTQGIKSIAKRVIKGLSGHTQEAENRVISLQTSFGGGKTHALISLYYLAQLGKEAKEYPSLKALLKYTGKPSFKRAQTAVFTNTSNDPTQGRRLTDPETGQKVHLRTLWGEIAYQLGGMSAYEIIKQNDRNRTAPKGLFHKVLEQTSPALILIDELADYSIAAAGVEVGASTLADQTISFVQELTEAIAANPTCVLVTTLPASKIEVANSSKGVEIFLNLEKRLGRLAKDTKPVNDQEIYQVIRRRLFKKVPSESQIRHIISQYIQLYERHETEIPKQALTPAYREKMIHAYPFHPELIDIFKDRWASNHNFQRTRGILRILAYLIKDLWNRQNSLRGSHYLIHTSDIELNNLEIITTEISKLFGHGYDAVASADLKGKTANAPFIDQHKPEYGKHKLAQGIASTIFMASFGPTGNNKGISIQDLKLALLKPKSFNHNSINGAIDALEARAHYLHHSSLASTGKRYWFHTKPNINILINQYKGHIGKEEILFYTLEQFKKIHSKHFQIIIDPQLRLAEKRILTDIDVSTKIPTLKRLSLIVLSPERTERLNQGEGKQNKELNAYIEHIATKRGGSNRIFRNTFLFLCASQAGYNQLIDPISTLLACHRVKEEYKDQIDAQTLNKKIAELESLIKTKIVSAYAFVKKVKREQIEQIQINSFNDSLAEQIDTGVYDLLIEEDWLLERIGIRTLNGLKLFPTATQGIAITKIYESFLRYNNFPMITGPEAIKVSLQKYYEQKKFAIGMGTEGNYTVTYFYPDPMPTLDLRDEDIYLISPSALETPKEEAPPIHKEELPYVPPPITQNPIQEPKAPPLTPPTPIQIQEIVISGSPSVDHFYEFLRTFIRPLKNNEIKLEVRISAKSTEASPLKEETDPYEAVKKAAEIMGLNFYKH